MTRSTDSRDAPAPPATRRIACGRCGAVFACRLDGQCWCARETLRLPLPVNAGDDCLCPDCLRGGGAATAG